MAAFLSVALVAGVAPWDARAFAENVSGGGSSEIALADAGAFDEPVSDGAEGEGGLADPVGEPAAETPVPAASSEDAGELDEDEPAGEAAAPLAARTAATDEPAADEPAAQAASLPIKTYGKGTAGTAPVRHALGETVAGSAGDQNGMVSMVGSYQFNATGNTNVRGKYTSIVAQALHSSRVEKLTDLSGAAADKALSGYDMAPMSSSYVGGKTTGGAGTGNYPATGNNSSSAELVRPSSTAKIVKAYLVIACTQSADFVSTASPLAQYGVSFVAPDEDTVYRMYPEVVYRDNGASDNGAKARYSCFFDVTDIVTSQKNRGYGWYTVLNIPMTSMSGGTDRNKADVGTDYFGSWRLVVVEEETTLPPRMLRLKLGGVAVQNGGAANVEISGEGLSVAPNPTGQLIASMDGTDCDSGNTQNISYTTSASSSAKIVTNNAMGRALSNKYFRLRIDNGSLLSDATSFDPAPINVNASGHSYESNAIKTTHNTDLTIQEINDNHGGMTLTGGESRVNMTVSTSSAPTILSVLGLALDIVAPEFRTTLTIANLDQHYSTADAGYEDKPNGRYAQTASAGDTLRATMVCENVSDSKKFIGLQDPVVTLKMKSFKTIDEDSISAFFYPGLYRDDSSQRPESEGKIILDNVQVTYNEAEGCYEITASSNKLEKIQEKGYFEVTFTGQANDSVDYVEYENYAAVEGDYVDEQNSVHDAFHMAALGSVYTTTASDKARYPLTVTAVGPGQATGTAKYYEGDIAEISWEADADAHVAAVFEDSSVRDDLVADSKAAPSQARMLALLRSVIRATPLANSAEVTMEGKAKEVIIVFEADDSEADDPEGPDNTVQENAFAVNTVADGGVASMTDSGTVQKGSDYSVSWSVKPGYRIVSVEVDGVAVPFNEGTSSIDFSQIGANHTVKVLTQRVASDGSDGTWVVSTTISGPGTISPTKAVRAGESYQVEWGAQAGSTDAVLSLVKVDGQVVYDEYLNNPKTDTDNEAKKDQTSVSFDNIRGNHTVEVVYRGTTVQNTYADDHVVDTAISGGLGTISPSVTVPESSTEDVTVTVTPEGGSEVEGIYLVRGSVRQLLENGKNGVVIATGADGKVTVTLPRDAIDANCTVEAILSAPDSDPGTPPSATYQITTAIAGGSGGKITASQIGIAAGESRQIHWESDADRHVIAVMVDGKMRDDLLTQGGVDFTNISGDHSVIVYVSDRESTGGDNPGGEPVNPDNPDGHDPNPVDPTNPERPGTPGNPGGIPSQPGDERYLYVNVTTIGAGVATPSVSAKVGGTAEVSWKAARGHKVASVVVDGIERLDLMRDLERGDLSFENIQRSHSVVVRFEKDPDYDPATDDREDPEDPDEAYDPDDPRDDIDVTDPAGYSLVTTKILGGSGDITGTTYNAPGSKRVVSWAPAEGYYVQAVYVDGKEITLADGQTSYEFANLEGGVHHSIEVRMAPLVPEEPDNPDNPDNPDGNGPGDGEGPDIVIDEPVTFPPMPGGVITPDDILDFIEDTFGDHPGLPDGVPEVVIRKDGQVVDKIDQSVPGTYVIEVTYTAADGTKRVVRLTYVVPGDGGAGGEGGAAGDSGDDATKVSLRGRLALAQTGDGVAAATATVLALALAAAAVLILARRRLGA
ncbi:hypothetical protein [uncultured Adlercreutzia sp.]|uniref:hypothetical protein n=1 Tax=uncultured Adlercreutzia sp. TaxID=875803 RepID=UPI0026774877|nr:hypothetical protein [uncultured Adlercreutzia sp.]